jgi:hypothetical protein
MVLSGNSNTLTAAQTTGKYPPKKGHHPLGRIKAHDADSFLSFEAAREEPSRHPPGLGVVLLASPFNPLSSPFDRYNRVLGLRFHSPAHHRLHADGRHIARRIVSHPESHRRAGVAGDLAIGQSVDAVGVEGGRSAQKP